MLNLDFIVPAAISYLDNVFISPSLHSSNSQFSLTTGGSIAKLSATVLYPHRAHTRVPFLCDFSGQLTFLLSVILKPDVLRLA